MARSHAGASRRSIQGAVAASCAGVALLAAACGGGQNANRPPLPVTVTSVLSSPGPASGSAYLVRYTLRGHPGDTFTCTVSVRHQGKVVGRTEVEIAGPIPRNGEADESTLVTTAIPGFPAAVADASVTCTQR